MRSLLTIVAVWLLFSTAFAQATRAYVVDSDQDKLYEMGMYTGGLTFIGSTKNNGLDTPADLAWRKDTHELWTVDLDGGEVGTIDPKTGAFQPVYYTGQSGWQALVWDAVGGVFLLTNQDGSTYVLDPTTTLTTTLGTTGFFVTALAIDGQGVIWGIDYSSGDIVQVNRASGAATSIARTIAGFQGLAIDPERRQAYGTNTDDGRQYKIDLWTGEAEVFGFSSTQYAKGIDVVMIDAFLVDNDRSMLYAVDLASGRASLIGSTFTGGLTDPVDATWDSSSSLLLVIDRQGGEIGWLDTTTGAFTALHQTGRSGWESFAQDPLLGYPNRFFLTDASDVYTYDGYFQTLTRLGPTGIGAVNSLELDASGRLWGVQRATGALVQIDRLTGRAISIATTVPGFSAFAIHRKYGWCYGANVTDDSLYALDLDSGAATRIGPLGGTIDYATGFALVSHPVEGFVVDSDTDSLFTVQIDGKLGFVASTANNGLDDPAGLAWRDDQRAMWTVDARGGEVGILDTVTGRFSPVFTTFMDGWSDITWDAFSRRFYLARDNGEIWSLDDAQRFAQVAGGVGHIAALDIDPTGDLVGIQIGGLLVRIDVVTGVLTPVVSTLPGFEGLAIPRSGEYYRAVNSQTDELYTVDPRDGSAYSLGALETPRATGLELIEPSCEGTVERVGQGCPGSAGQRPRMLLEESPCVGSGWISISLETATNDPAFYIVGFSDTRWGGLPLPVDLGVIGAPGCLVYVSHDLVLGPVLSPMGFWPAITLPRRPIFVGVTFYLQAIQLDPAVGTSLKLIVSDYLRVTIGREPY